MVSLLRLNIDGALGGLMPTLLQEYVQDHEEDAGADERKKDGQSPSGECVVLSISDTPRHQGTK